MKLSENILKLRKEAGISQKKLAEQIGVSQASIGYWEKGQRTPSAVAIHKLANFFDVTPSYLMDQDTNKKNIIKKNSSSESINLNPGDIILDITKENYEKYTEYFDILFSEIKKYIFQSYDANVKIIHVDTGEEIKKENLEEMIDSLSKERKLILFQAVAEALVINPIFHTVKIYFTQLKDE